jgi:TolB-like protein
MFVLQSSRSGPRRTFALVLAVASFGALSQAVVARAEGAPLLPPGRVVVLDDAGDLRDAEVSRLSELIETTLRQHPAFVVVPNDESKAALVTLSTKKPACRTDEGCLAELGRQLKADHIVDASVSGSSGSYVLRVAVLDPSGKRAVARTSEPMKRLKSLALNVDLCLERLFQWNAPVVAEAEPAKVPAPATGSEALARKRVMILDLKAAGLDDKLTAALPALIAQEIARHPGYDVASADDVQRLVSLQAQKQAVGCTQDDSCLVEVSKKLQADIIVSGSIGKVGESVVLNLGLVNPREMSKATGAMETVSRAEDLPAAIIPCLAKLFHWNGAQNPAFHLPKGRKLSFAVLDLKPTGISQSSAQNLTQVLSVTVKGIEGASVISREDISAMLQLSAAKMETGCADDSCMAEIGGALGVDRLISGDVGQIGETFIVNLRLIDVRHGEVENRVTESYRGEEEQLLRAVRHAAHALLGLPFEGAGRLAVTATQNAAHVFVDEDKKGQTPIPIEGLKVGRHDVRVAHDGFFDWRGEIYVDPAETTSVWAQLKERPQAWYQKWWVWTIAGAVVVGATVTTVAVTRPPATVGHGTVTLQ